MRKAITKPLVAVFACFLTIILITGVSCWHKPIRHSSPKPEYKGPEDTLVCVLDLPEFQGMSNELYIGYCYDLMKMYAADRRKPASIRLSKRNENLEESLLRGSADIVCTPFPRTFESDSLNCSTPVDSLFLCFTSIRDKAEADSLNGWIGRYNSNPIRDSIRLPYIHPFNPRGKDTLARNKGYISPYDNFIREAADSSGFDWRLIAAMLYQESHFHIEAVSVSGALGLAQMVPSTASLMGVTDHLDPESNIVAGAMYLRKIYRQIYYTQGDSHLKFALAAYSSGLGNLVKAWEHTDSIGLDPNVWEDVRESFIMMARDSVFSLEDSTMVPCPAGPVYMQAVHYVNSVLSYYNKFKVFPK